MLSVERLSSGYGGAMIVDDVSINILKGEIVAIIGPNGCGKSTLLKTIFGLLKPYSGQLIFNGLNITGFKPFDLVATGIGYVPQTGNVFPALTVFENLELGGYLSNHPDFSEVFPIFPVLGEKKKELAMNLSGGERQMLALGRAMMTKPELLLLDEPSAGLAPKMVEIMMEKIKEIAETESSVLLVEQNIKSALRIAHRGYILSMGKKVFEGTAEEILEHKAYKTGFLRIFPESTSDSILSLR